MRGRDLRHVRTLASQGTDSVVDMAEHVRQLDLGVSWDPNAPDAVLMSDDRGRTSLAVRASVEDADRRSVVLVWTGVLFSSLGAPNDEAIAGHRLYDKGIREVLWAGGVEQSELVKSLEQQNRVHARHVPTRYDDLEHHVVLLKEGVVEVVARALTIERHAGATVDSAVIALGR